MQVSSLRLIALGVALAGVLVHVSTLSAGFVYDDHRFVEVNSKVRSIDPLLFFSDASSASASQGIQPDVYRPLRTLSYAIDHALFGLRPWGWHLVNLLWHGLAAGLLFRLLLPLLGDARSRPRPPRCCSPCIRSPASASRGSRAEATSWPWHSVSSR